VPLLVRPKKKEKRGGEGRNLARLREHLTNLRIPGEKKGRREIGKKKKPRLKLRQKLGKGGGSPCAVHANPADEGEGGGGKGRGGI